MAVRKTYYYKTLNELNYVVAFGKMSAKKQPTESDTFKLLTEEEYKFLQNIFNIRPESTDDSHVIVIVDNLDGTYSYEEIEKPSIEDE